MLGFVLDNCKFSLYYSIRKFWIMKFVCTHQKRREGKILCTLEKWFVHRRVVTLLQMHTNTKTACSINFLRKTYHFEYCQNVLASIALNHTQMQAYAIYMLVSSISLI